MLSAVIIARDEADRIGDCLRSLDFCDEVLVLDGGSADATVAEARALGARVVEGDWPGFVAQKNRAWSLARGEWVLSIDADERVDPRLRASIVAALAAPTADGFRLHRRNVYLGRPLVGGTAWPDPHVRLARRDRARWVGDDPHDRLEVDGVVAQLDGELVHHPYRSLADHLLRIDRYTTLDARPGTVLDLLVRPGWHFFRGFVARAGFRDGYRGALYALLGALYVFLKWGRNRL